MTARNLAPMKRPRNWATMWLTVIASLLFLNLMGQAYTLFDTYQIHKLADEGAAASSTQVDPVQMPLVGPGRDCWREASPVCSI
jgi:hypothetical protein